MLNHKVKIPIGDWSNDGHCKCDWYTFKTNYSVEDLRRAYFASKENLDEDVCPENVCSRYQEPTIEKEQFNKIMMQFPDICIEDVDIEDEHVWVDDEFMISLIFQFIKYSLPNLVVEEIDGTEMLPFYGFDDRGRHIKFWGYGLFD